MTLQVALQIIQGNQCQTGFFRSKHLIINKMRNDLLNLCNILEIDVSICECHRIIPIKALYALENPRITV